MNNEVNAKLEALEILLDKQRRKYKKSMITTIICYAILVIFVIIYTTYVMSQIKKLGTPKTVAELITMKIGHKIPVLKDYIASNADMYATITADNAINYAHSLMPSLGILIKDQLNNYSDTILQELSTKYTPALNKYFERHKSSISAGLETLSDEEAAKQLSLMLIEIFNRELDLACINLDNSVCELQKKNRCYYQKT
jgi:hypothetical protein